MKIVMMGSGGVCGYFGARLAAGGADVYFVARGAHLEAMRSQGLTIEGDRRPGPEACGLRYLLEYKANIFVKNFILSTKSTLVGGQLGGLF